MRQELLRFGLPMASALGLFAGETATPRALVRFALTIVKFFGLFHLARYITRDALRIICYHGFAVAEEYKYRSTLFIRQELFRRRMEYLQRQGYPILPLSEAIEALNTGQLPPC